MIYARPILAPSIFDPGALDMMNAADPPRLPLTRAANRSFGWILMSVLVLGACGGEPPAEADVARPVKMFTVGLGAGAASLEYPGSVSAAQEAVMSFEVEGRILQLPVAEGQRVGRGQLLARLDARDYAARLAADRSVRNAALADYRRYQDLYAADAVSLQDLEVARRNYEVSEANLAISQKAVDDTELRALFGGTVARTLVEQFENVRAKQAVLTLHDATGLEIRVSVPERDVVLAVPGLTLEERTARARPEVEIAAMPGRRFAGQVSEFTTQADPVTRTFEATIRFQAPPETQILPGMTGRVVLRPDLGEGEAGRYWIPANAVRADDDGRAVVWVVDESTMTVQATEVELGSLSGAELEIVRGLALGDLIAVSGVHELRDGMEVRRLEDRG
jgi:RND family efflux transporter MFP subunit